MKTIYSDRLVLEALRKTLEHKDFGTYGHSYRLSVTVEIIGKSLGLTQGKLEELMLVAQFHDLGKVLIPDSILFKPGPLTHEEWLQMQQHAYKGAEIAKSIKDLSHLQEYIYLHHERWDGMGYPEGLSGYSLPLYCRIVNIADSFDAMTSNRPYRSAKSTGEAMGEVLHNTGSQFDPNIVQVFLEKCFPAITTEAINEGDY